MKNITVSIIIPSYNEALRISPTIEKVHDYFSTTEVTDYECIIVNDGSADETGQILENLQKLYPEVKGINLQINQGKGNALRRGIERATGKYILTLDADGSTPISEYKKLFDQLMEENDDIAIGSRHLERSHILIKQPWYRVLISRAANLLIQITLLPGIKDTQCGFKLYKADVAKKLFSQSKINGFGIDMEILSLAKKQKLRIKEVPVDWLDSKNSTLRPVRSTLRTLLELIKIIYSSLYSKNLK